MRTTTITMRASLLAIIASALPAMAQEACQTYQVRAGDNLKQIAERAYGNADFRLIYDANSAAIGDDPNIIKEGMVLQLPCIEGTPPAPQANDNGNDTPRKDTSLPASTSAPAKAATGDTVTLITGNDFPPFTDEALPGRGLFTQLVETAAIRSPNDQALKITFVNDWDAHLETLLPAMAFDGSFPWLKPDCESYDVLSEGDRTRCDSYLFSDPFYEVVDGFFANKGSRYGEIYNYEDLKGTRICRPEGYSTAHLDTVGLNAKSVTFVRPVQVTECFTALLEGQVDVVALDTLVANDILIDMGAKNVVQENPNIGEVKALHVIVHKDHPNAQQTLDMLNAGLKEMMVSGEWSAITSEALRRNIQPLEN